MSTKKSVNVCVLDSCVLLHEPQSLYRFAEHDIYLPLAVIDDLDDIKTRPGNIGWSAREVFRILDKYNIEEMTGKGVQINDKGGKLFIYNPDIPSIGDSPNISRINSDNAIIESSRNLQKKFPRRKVIIISKDIGLRIRGYSFGVQTENYISDLIEDDIYTGIKNIQIDNNEDWSLLWLSDEHSIDSFSKKLQEQFVDLYPNEFLIFNWGEIKCPTIFKNNKIKVLKSKSNDNSTKKNYLGITPKNIEQTCAMEILSDPDITMVSLCGPAGTGKTLMSLATALHQIQNGIYKKIVIIKPIVPVSGRDLGYLPGDKYEKISHWLGPIRDNIAQLESNNKTGGDLLEEMVESDIIEVEAMTYIQGRSIPNSIIMVDECQNLTTRESRMVVERVSNKSKVILLGDLTQVENPYLDSRSCGLAHALNGGKGKEACAAITLNKVERSSLAAIASDIFKNTEGR